MKYSDEKLKDKFEKEVWLYLDKDLPDTQMQFWDEKIIENVHIKEMLNDILLITEKYNEPEETKIDGELFDRMIEKTIEQKTFRKQAAYFFDKIKNNKRNIVKEKFAFGLTLIVLVIALLTISSKKNNIKTVPLFTCNKDLAWEGKAIDRQIDKLSTMIMFTKNEEYKKYYLYKISTDQWNRNTFTLSNKIRNIKEELENNKF